MLLLRSIELRSPAHAPAKFPYTIPFIKAFERVEFSNEVTFLVGENGSGKSTFLEILACAVGSITVGSESVRTDKSLTEVRELANQMRLTWTKRTRKGFFMRAEDFFGYAKKLAQVREEMEQDLDDIEDDYKDRSQTAKDLARMPYLREIGALRRSYGDGLDTNSHGESFIHLFKERFVGEGLYLLDEPEAPLSPNRQLALLALIKSMVDQHGQFVIATHSPILLAYPGASILSFDGGQIHAELYEALEHVITMKSFLNNPEAYLRHLME